MPEIAECYTIAKKIPLLGKLKQIKTSNKFDKYLNKNNSVKENLLKNSYFGKPIAYGKTIWFPFENNEHQGIVISKLGMSGSFFINNSIRDNKHNHFKLYFENCTLFYSDPRMFGNFELFLFSKETTKKEILNYVIKKTKIGLDPLCFSNKEVFQNIISWKKSEQSIKKLLLNQNKISGIGNYLASEILFDSKINPYTKGSQLSDQNIKQIIQSSKKIIKLAIKMEGYSFAKGYFHPDGSIGQMNKKIKIYGKSTCPTCKKDIKKEYIDNRASYFCPKCQQL